MLHFSKGKKQRKENAVNANELLDSNDRALQKGDKEMETTLSVPSDWHLSDEERYVFAFHNSQSPKLKVNQISIYGMEISNTKNGLEVTGLIRSTVVKDIQFGKTTILLLDGEKEVVARKEFDLAAIGTLPSNSARPWTFVFGQDDIMQNPDAELNDWSLAFELKKKHQLDLEESWEKSIAKETKDSLERIVENAPSLKPGEVNFMGIEAKVNDNKDLVVTMLIRNGADKNITLQQIPLGVKDATGEEIARGTFKLKDFTIKANTSKPWSFIFPESMVQKEQLDLSRWQAYPIQ